MFPLMHLLMRYVRISQSIPFIFDALFRCCGSKVDGTKNTLESWMLSSYKDRGFFQLHLNLSATWKNLIFILLGMIWVLLFSWWISNHGCFFVIVHSGTNGHSTGFEGGAFGRTDDLWGTTFSRIDITVFPFYRSCHAIVSCCYDCQQQYFFFFFYCSGLEMAFWLLQILSKYNSSLGRDCQEWKGQVHVGQSQIRQGSLQSVTNHDE